VKYSREWMTFHLSKEWKDVDREIVIGLIQHLLLKVHKKKGTTTNIDLYYMFSKGLSKYSEASKTEPQLEDSFTRINEKFFSGEMDKPNLIWGDQSFRTLGKYEYNTNTITISRIFQESDSILLDYIMYHEMLHKKHQFKANNGRHLYHSSAFRADEAKFPNQEVIEKKLSMYASKVKRQTKQSFDDSNKSSRQIKKKRSFLDLIDFF